VRAANIVDFASDQHRKRAELEAAPLARQGVQHRVLELPPHPRRDELLAQATLDEGERAELLALAGPLVDSWAQRYPARDLVVLEPGQPGLEELLARFARPHIHADDEVRFILDGEGVFGVFLGDALEQVLPVKRGDLLIVPAGIEHRFGLTASRRLKALRLFTDPAGWAAQETGRAVAEALA
jgi:1,2-dihydroxy-3-keto-5-methylthiopentene dioxygenase